MPSMSKVKEKADVLNHMGFTALEVLDHYPKEFKSFAIQNIFMDAGVERAKNQSILPPPSAITIGHHELATPTESS